MAVTKVATKMRNLSTSFAPAGFGNNANAGRVTTTVTQALSMARSKDTGGRRRWFAEEREHQRQSHGKLRKSADPAGAQRRGSPSDGGGSAPSHSGSGSDQRTRDRAAAVRARQVARRRCATITTTATSSLCGSPWSR